MKDPRESRAGRTRSDVPRGAEMGPDPDFSSAITSEPARSRHWVRSDLGSERCPSRYDGPWGPGIGPQCPGSLSLPSQLCGAWSCSLARPCPRLRGPSCVRPHHSHLPPRRVTSWGMPTSAPTGGQAPPAPHLAERWHRWTRPQTESVPAPGFCWIWKKGRNWELPFLFFFFLF